MNDAPGLEQRVADLTGRVTRGATPLSGGDICDAWRIETDAGPVFAKTRADAPEGFFTTEAAGLAWLAEPGFLAVPEVLGVAGDVLVLAHVAAGRRTAEAGRELGAGLARLHAAGAPGHGACPPGGGTAGFLATLGVQEQPVASWREHFVVQRLVPLADEAERRGALPAGVRGDLDRVAGRVMDPADGLAGPDVPAARLHGDLWGGNVIWGADGRPWLIDPAAHGGHPETDLAMMQLFGGFPDSAFAAYDEVTPPLPGRDERVGLHQLVPLLVHACLFGGSYGAQIGRVLRCYG